MKIILEKLIEDREAGTPGPWRIRENVRHSQEECDLTICGDIWQLADINGPQYAHQGANARRIARLPDLEAAYIEAVELLRNAMSIVENCVIEDGFCCCGDDMQWHSDPMTCGHSPVDHGGYVAQQFHDAARKFLGDSE